MGNFSNRYELSPEQKSTRTADHVVLLLKDRFLTQADAQRIIFALNECMRTRETEDGQ